MMSMRQDVAGPWASLNIGPYSRVTSAGGHPSYGKEQGYGPVYGPSRAHNRPERPRTPLQAASSRPARHKPDLTPFMLFSGPFAVYARSPCPLSQFWGTLAASRPLFR